MASLSLAMQVAFPGIPLGWGKLELAEVPALLGASLTGPVGGAIVAFAYGVPSPGFAALVPLALVDFTLVGYLARNRRWGWKAIPVVHIAAYLTIGTFLFNRVYGVPMIAAILEGLAYSIPSALIAALLYASLARTPKVGALFK